MSLTKQLSVVAAAGLLAACSGDYSANESYQRPEPSVGQNAGIDESDTLFGEGGLTLGRALDGSIFEGTENGDRSGSLPVNRYLWQGTLETLDFLPLASADAYSGVIATEWATTPGNPTQRMKVAAFVTSHELSAASLRIAVYREDLADGGVWVARPVSPETARKLEDAILTRSRQIRIAEVEADQAS